MESNKPDALDHVAATLAAAIIGKRTAQATAASAVNLFYEVRDALLNRAAQGKAPSEPPPRPAHPSTTTRLPIMGR